MRTYTFSLIVVSRMIYLPTGSTMQEWIVQSKLFLIRIAPLCALGLPWEGINFAPHLFLHCASKAGCDCVSCHKMISEFLFRHQLKIILLLWKLHKLAYKEFKEEKGWQLKFSGFNLLTEVAILYCFHFFIFLLK